MDWDSVADFHQRTKWTEGDGAASGSRGYQKDYARFRNTLLHGGSKSTVGELVAARRSERAFSIEPRNAGEVFASVSAYLVSVNDGQRRTTPSAGAFTSTEVYGICRDADQWSVLHANPSGSATSLWPLEAEEIGDCFLWTSWWSTARIIIVISVKLAPVIERYGPRGYRFALLEAGAASMSIDLIVRDLGFSTCIVGAFDDNRLGEILGIEPWEAEVPAVALIAGPRADLNATA